MPDYNKSINDLIQASPVSGSGKLVDNYKSIDDLIQDSPIIVIGTVASANDKFDYKGVTFALTRFKVETLIRGEVPEMINIIQTVMSEDPLINKDNKMVLFLVKYIGPVTKDEAYRMKGLYQGQYRIEDNTIIKNQQNTLSGDEVLESVETLTTRIIQVGYQPKSTGSNSK